MVGVILEEDLTLSWIMCNETAAQCRFLVSSSGMRFSLIGPFVALSIVETRPVRLLDRFCPLTHLQRHSRQ